MSAAFSPDGKRIVTASMDKTARLWDAATGQPIGEPLKGHDGAVWSAAFSPDGKRIVTASEDKTARIWDVFPDTQALVSHAKAAVPRCLTPRSAKPSSCRPSRQHGASRWRSGLTTRPYGSNGSPTSAPARSRRSPPIDSNSPFPGMSGIRPSQGIFRGSDECVLWAVTPISGAIWNDGYRADSSPSRGGRCRLTTRPIEASTVAVRYDRNTSICVEKLRLIEAPVADSLLLGCRRFGR